jgi:hypothetical protein
MLPYSKINKAIAYLIKHRGMEKYVNEGTAPRIFNLSIQCSQVISFKSLPL